MDACGIQIGGSGCFRTFARRCHDTESPTPHDTAPLPFWEKNKTNRCYVGHVHVSCRPSRYEKYAFDSRTVRSNNTERILCSLNSPTIRSNNTQRTFVFCPSIVTGFCRSHVRIQLPALHFLKIKELFYIEIFYKLLSK